MIFTRKNDIVGPQITRKGPKCTILEVRFFNVPPMSHMWWTGPGQEEKIFGWHYFRGANEKVWSNSMIINVSMTVEKWYGGLIFWWFSTCRFWVWYCEVRSGNWLRVSQEKSLIHMVLWSVITRVWSHVVGETYKLYSKTSRNFLYFLKKKFSPLLVSWQAAQGRHATRGGGDFFF